MNQKNFDYLDDQIFYTGFGNTLSNELKEALSKGRESFSIPFQKNMGNDTAEGALNFRKSKQGDLYFFNSFDISIKNGDTEKVRSQNFRVDSTFYRNEDGSPANIKPNITLKEAYNLMSGRAVRKDIVEKVDNVNELKNAWIQLNFKETDSKGNFQRQEFPEYNMESHLNKMPFKELANEEYRSNLVDSIERGNRQSVIITDGVNETTAHVEASPRFDTLNLFDENMKRMPLTLATGESQGVTNDIQNPADQNLNQNGTVLQNTETSAKTEHSENAIQSNSQNSQKNGAKQQSANQVAEGQKAGNNRKAQRQAR